MYKPFRFGLYVTDRIDLGDLVIDLGLRYDRQNSDVLFPRTPGRVFSDPLRQGISGLARLSTLGITPTAEDSATRGALRGGHCRERHDGVVHLQPVPGPLAPRAPSIGARVLSGYRPDGVPPVLCPAGPGACLQPVRVQRQYGPGGFGIQQRLRPGPGLWPDDPVRVRHPARLQPERGPRHLGLQQRQDLGCRGPGGADPGSLLRGDSALGRLYQPGFRQRARGGHQVRPADRPAVSGA